MANETFGGFCKRRRLAIGQKLREFCRKHDLDAGNISRLERDLVPPPKSKKLLKAYAKALNLQIDSVAGKEFFRLAELSRKQLPDEIAADPDKQGIVKAARRRKVVRISPHSRLVNVASQQLIQWADLLDARSELPRLLRRLVHDTSTKIETISFPAGEGVQRPGFDGFVMTSKGSAFVPKGVSVWECGCDVKVVTKANKDFAKRTENRIGIAPNQSTFVFVTPRRWPNKDAWCREKKRLRTWKDVRVIDADDLEQWLELSPSVSVWLAERLGIRPPGVKDASRHWDDVSSLAQPPFLPDVFLASRKDAEKRLLEWLAGPADVLALESRSPTEVVDFYCAFLASSRTPETEQYLSRTVLVEDRRAWEVLCDSKQPSILVALPQLILEPELISSAVRNGHHVLLSMTSCFQPKCRVEALPRVYRHELEKALEASGFAEVEAENAARAAGGSLTVLKRFLTRVPELNRPVWAADDRAAMATPFMWIGGWMSNKLADREAVERLGGQPYRAIESQATYLAKCNDPLLLHAADRWGVLSRDDAWMLLGRFATEHQFRMFEELAVEVLIEYDPQFDLPENERWIAGVREYIPRFSGALKEGIAETMALLASFAEFNPTRLPATWNVNARIESVVRKVLPANVSWKRWASLNSVLPLLAEAAPDAFLRAVEDDLRRTEPELAKLFHESGHGLTGGCHHAGLLWALELIAWSPRYLQRVCGVLLSLSDADLDNSWGNTPESTLEQIFSPWYPQTSATIDDRLKIIDALIESRTEPAWRFLLSLLPDVGGGFAMPIRKPYWRDWAMSWTPGTTNASYWKQVEYTAHRIVEKAGTNTLRWCQIIEHLEQFPHSVHPGILEGLKYLDPESTDSETRKKLADFVRAKVDRNRAAAKADWTLPVSFLKGLEEFHQRWEPSNAVLCFGWLFEDFPERIMKGNGTWEKKEAKLKKKRSEALVEILATHGFAGISELVRRVKSPGDVGHVFARTVNEANPFSMLPELLDDVDSSVQGFVRAFVWSRFSQLGWHWIDCLQFDSWSSEQIGMLMACLPFGRDVWQRVERFSSEVRRVYWANTGAWNAHFDGPETELAVAKLLEHERPLPAIRLVGFALRHEHSVSEETLLRPLEDALKLSSEALKPLGDLQYVIQRIVEHVQLRDDVNVGRVAGLELKYLTILDDKKALTLHRLLSRDPSFLIEALRMVFRSRKEERDEELPEVDREARSRLASQIYRLLRSWKLIPGQDKNGLVDVDSLRKWLDEVRRLADEDGRLEVCDSKVGELFGKCSLHDTDGRWPIAAIRGEIERVASEDLERGFYIGVRNSRGVTSRSLREGGVQERKEAEKYEGLAERIDFESPRTAAVLRTVAEAYRHQARREDEKTEWRVS